MIADLPEAADVPVPEWNWVYEVKEAKKRKLCCSYAGCTWTKRMNRGYGADHDIMHKKVDACSSIQMCTCEAIVGLHYKCSFPGCRLHSANLKSVLQHGRSHADHEASQGSRMSLRICWSDKHRIGPFSAQVVSTAGELPTYQKYSLTAWFDAEQLPGGKK